MKTLLMTSSKGNFSLYEISREIGNNIQKQLEVQSTGLADDHVVDIRLSLLDYSAIKNGESHKYDPYDITISHGFSSNAEMNKISKIEEYILVLQEAVEFASIIKLYIVSNGWC